MLSVAPTPVRAILYRAPINGHGVVISGATAFGTWSRAILLASMSTVTPLYRTSGTVWTSITQPNNTIGGQRRRAANVIGFNGDNGVFVNASSGNAILSNSIFSNSTLGIRLTAANNNQAPPVLSSVTSSGGSIVIQSHSFRPNNSNCDDAVLCQ